MVYFDQHIVLPAETQVYINIIILVLFLMVLAVAFLGVMMYQLSVSVRMQSEMLLGVSDRLMGKSGEAKKE